MILIRQEVQMVSHTPNPEMLIEKMGRLCYRSEATAGSTERFVKMLLEKGHHSVLEHAVASFIFTTNRAIANELVRHRLASYSQESTRYVDYAKRGAMEFIAPFADSPGMASVETSYEEAEQDYLDRRAEGATPEEVRDLLPLGLATRIGVTANFREWLHILELRESPKAHPHMRELMGFAREDLRAIAPTVFGLTSQAPVE